MVDHQRFTMVVFAELLMGITKVAYSITSGKAHLETQAEVIQMRATPLLNVLRVVFPIFALLARIEDAMLAPWLNGHMLIAKGHVQK